MRSNGGEESCAIALELAGADAGDFRERIEITRPAPYHVDERCVMEDDIGRNTLVARERQAQCPQSLPQPFIGRGRNRVRSGRARALLATLGFVGLGSQRDRHFAAQHSGGAIAHVKPAMAFDIHGEMTQRHELAENGMPFVFTELDANTEGLDLVMTEILDALGRLAEQHIDEIGRTEALTSADHRRNGFLRRDQPIPNALRPQTIVAIAAGRMIALAEIAEQDLTAAFRRFAIAQERIQFLALDTA